MFFIIFIIICLGNTFFFVIFMFINWCDRINLYTWENAFVNVLYLMQMHRREKIGGTEARTLEWRRMLHWNLIYGRDTPIACSTRNRECKSRARAQSADCHSRCIAHVPRGKTHEETYICMREEEGVNNLSRHSPPPAPFFPPPTPSRRRRAAIHSATSSF